MTTWYDRLIACIRVFASTEGLCALHLFIGSVESTRMKNVVTNAVITNNLIEDCGIYGCQHRFDSYSPLVRQ